MRVSSAGGRLGNGGMAALAGADDGCDPRRIQGAQVGIADQRRRAVPAAGVLAMAGGAGAVEIAFGLRHLGRADAGLFLGGHLNANLGNNERGDTDRHQGQGKLLHGTLLHCGALQDRLVSRFRNSLVLYIRLRANCGIAGHQQLIDS